MFFNMRSHLRNNLVAYIALFFALGGGAYAATLGRNSVHSNQIAPGAVKSRDIAKEAVKLRHLGFPLAATGEALPDTSIPAGPSPHMFPALTLKGDPIYMFVGVVQFTNPQDNSRAAAEVTVTINGDGKSIYGVENPTTVPDGSTMSIPVAGTFRAGRGVHTLELGIASIGAVGDVNGGSFNVAALPAVQQPAVR
jgi:hypothetical protein